MDYPFISSLLPGILPSSAFQNQLIISLLLISNGIDC